MSSGGSTHKPTRCLYECLEVNRNADDAEIKKAYRKAALRWHPDKNTGNDEATAVFQEIQHAYAVLADPHERSWYDNHREEIIKGTDGEATNKKVNIFPYFSATAFSGFDDNSCGFYAVYTEAFDKIFSSERDEYKENEYPPIFGKSTTEYKYVAAFYNFWTHFSSRLSFAWKDEHNPNDAPSRRIRRLIEKDNMKVRLEARKKYTSEIKGLVDYVCRRDRRVVQEQQRIQLLKMHTEKENKLKAQKKVEDMKRRKKEWAEEKFLEEQLENSWEISAESNCIRLADYSSDENNRRRRLNDGTIYRCTLCRKDFKSAKQMENHELSKMHRKKIEELDSELLLEALAGDSDESISDNSADEVLSGTKNADIDEDTEETTILYERLEALNIKPAAIHSDATENKSSSDSEESDDFALERMKNLYVKTSKDEKYHSSSSSESEVSSSDSKEQETIDASQDISSYVDHDDANNFIGKSSKKKKNNSGREKIEINGVKMNDCNGNVTSNINLCTICGEGFNSRTKMFAHLKASGHAALKK